MPILPGCDVLPPLKPPTTSPSPRSQPATGGKTKGKPPRPRAADRFGVLNAVGVSRRQIMAQLVLEYAFLVVFGVVAGVVIGNFAADLFVPFFRFTGEKGVPLPPLLPIIADRQAFELVIVFTVTIVLAELATVAMAFRQQLGKILR